MSFKLKAHANDDAQNAQSNVQHLVKQYPLFCTPHLHVTLIPLTINTEVLAFNHV